VAQNWLKQSKEWALYCHLHPQLIETQPRVTENMFVIEMRKQTGKSDETNGTDQSTNLKSLQKDPKRRE
jgi:hypothetical protein